MGFYLHVRGWAFATEPELLEAARQAVEASLDWAPKDGLTRDDIAFHNRYWVFSPLHSGGGHVYYGNDSFRTDKAPFVRAQVEALARAIYNPAVSPDDPDYLQGMFYVTIQEGGEWLWELRGGEVHVQPWPAG